MLDMDIIANNSRTTALYPDIHSVVNMAGITHTIPRLLGIELVLLGERRNQLGPMTIRRIMETWVILGHER